jgi:hypothetical protein
MRKLTIVGVFTVLAATACALEGGNAPDLGQSEGALCGFTLDVKKSLLVHRADTVNGSATILDAFPFQSVLDAIVASSPNETTTSATLYREWMSVAESSATPGAEGAFHCDTSSVDPNHWGYECPRTSDAALGDVDPFTPADRFVPVALVNRFDLAPSNWSNCGEYRVVFAKKSGQGAGRFFFIFEAKLPNPGGSGSAAGCKAVAEVWQGLSAPGVTLAQRKAKLRAFYFDGVDVTIPGTGTVKTTPVFTWSNYGPNMGQVRTNQFVSFPWDLREFKLSRTCSAGSCTLRSKPVMVKTNLADDPLVNAGDPSHASAVAAVQNNLVTSRLLATDAASISAKIPAALDSWESRDDQAVDYSAITPTAVKAELTMPAGSTLTKNQALDRLTTQTCMGCHQHSNGKNLGGGVTWPNSLGFVHIDELGNASQALLGTFLPARAAFMTSIVEAGCAGAQAAPAFKDDDAVN